MMFPMWWDNTYFLVIIGMLICMWASSKVKRTFAKYDRVRNNAGMTGKDAARRILNNSGLNDVRIEHVRGNLSDHYDPRSKVLRLSDSTYNSTSVAAVGVAAHECGHAVQHAHHYAPLTIRGALVPVANFGSAIAWPLIIFGAMINSQSASILIDLGIIAFSASVLFQLVTLPVEFNASHRALRILTDTGMLTSQEVAETRKVLGAAALTYVAAAGAAILQLLRVLILTGRVGSDEE